MSSEREDKKEMEEGIEKLLGKKEYPVTRAAPECIHEPDGFIYGETATYLTLRCNKCGTYYDKQKSL